MVHDLTSQILNEWVAEGDALDPRDFTKELYVRNFYNCRKP